MKRKIFFVSLLILISKLVAPQILFAQKSYLQEVSFEQTQALKKGNQIAILSMIQLDQLEISSQELIILVPKLISLDGENECLLPPVFVAGKTRAKVLERESRLHNERAYMSPKPLSITTRRNGTEQSISYATQVAYEPWMSAASLSFVEWVMGCAECEKGRSSVQVIDRIIAAQYKPSYRLAYIVPEAEAVKSREDRYVATVNFRVGKDELEYNYLNNREVLDEVQEKVAKVVRNKDLTVSDIQVIGYASPEASMTYNKALSERRAKSIADFLVQKFDIPREKMKVKGYGEDWGGVRDAVAASEMADKEAVLHIIDTTPNLDARDAQLKKLSKGSTYQRLLDEIYPQIRRTEYALSYVVRGFDIEEAKQVLKDNPKLLSLNEMYLVAKSYPAESKEFKEVFDIATRLYPTEAVAIINASAADIEGGNHEAAIHRLEKIKEDARAWNNLAVAYALAGDDEQAEVYFTKAIQADDKLAKLNHEEFQKALANKGEE